MYMYMYMYMYHSNYNVPIHINFYMMLYTCICVHTIESVQCHKFWYKIYCVVWLCRCSRLFLLQCCWMRPAECSLTSTSMFCSTCALCCPGPFPSALNSMKSWEWAQGWMLYMYMGPLHSHFQHTTLITGNGPEDEAGIELMSACINVVIVSEVCMHVTTSFDKWCDVIAYSVNLDWLIMREEWWCNHAFYGLTFTHMCTCLYPSSLCSLSLSLSLSPCPPYPPIHFPPCSILAFNKGFLALLHSRLTDWGPEVSIGDIFIGMVSHCLRKSGNVCTIYYMLAMSALLLCSCTNYCTCVYSMFWVCCTISILASSASCVHNVCFYML